jgi:signal-transduction protein with cAMP-binding, CBS, and nucleotidyltransferase domain
MRMRDVVRRGLVTIDAARPIAEAARLMDEQAVGAVVVVEHGDLVGIVTDRDLVVRGLARRYPPDARVDSVMSTDVIALDANADTHDAVRLFRRHAVRRVPIVEGRRPIGMITADDLLVESISELADIARPIVSQVVHRHPEPSPPAVVG